jgi:diacylglycerol kinase family enzyme
LCGLRGGDLWRTVGGSGARAAPSPGADATWCPVDLLRVRAGDDTWWVVSHLVARRRRGWRGELVVVMNSQFHGAADVAPRAHPNDGRADVLRVAPGFGAADRWKALRRARTGTHVPHPLIEERRVARSTIVFDRPLDVVTDGIRRGRFERVDVEVVPDAITVVI